MHVGTTNAFCGQSGSPTLAPCRSAFMIRAFIVWVRSSRSRSHDAHADVDAMANIRNVLADERPFPMLIIWRWSGARRTQRWPHPCGA